MRHATFDDREDRPAPKPATCPRGVPATAPEGGRLDQAGVDARPLSSDHGFRQVALIWRRSSPREEEFRLLADALRQIAHDLNPSLGTKMHQPREVELA